MRTMSWRHVTHWSLPRVSWTVAVLAAVIRGAAVLASARYTPLHDDASYLRTSLTLLQEHHYPVHRVVHVGLQASAYRPPGWPLVLWALWALAGVHLLAARVLLILLGVAVCVVGARLGARLAGPAGGLAAGVVLAVQPLNVAVGATLESETLFTALVLASVLAALEAHDRRRTSLVVLAGALAGAAALTRSNGLLLVPVIGLCTVGDGRAALRQRLLPVGLACVTAVLVIMPWTVRNAIDLHHFVPVSTEAGNTLAGTYNTASLHEDARWLEPRKTGAYAALYRRFGGGPALDTALIGGVGHWVARHPGYPVMVLLVNSGRLLGLDGPGWAAFSLRTMSLGGHAGGAVWLGSLLVSFFGLSGLLRLRRRRTAAALGAVAVVLVLTTAPFNGEMRLAAPLQAVLAIPAAVGFLGLRHLPDRLMAADQRRVP